MQYLIETDEQLEQDITATLLAGNGGKYPASHSDMNACVRMLMRMFEINHRTTPYRLRRKCPTCLGIGQLRSLDRQKGALVVDNCTACDSKGYLEEKL